MTLGVLVLVTISYFFSAILGLFCKIGFGFEIDENLGNYFKSLEMDDKQWMYMEEDNVRNNYNMKMITD